MTKWLLLLLASVQIFAVTSTYDQLYRRLYAKKSNVPATFFSAGTLFIGAPYEGGTLDANPEERLVVNFESFDCVTFIETSLALSHSVRYADSSPDSFAKNLTHIRYRSGRLDGYASRLHYFSDWIIDNEKKGIVREITKEAGGSVRQKIISFMSRNARTNSFLADKKILAAIESTERSLSAMQYYRIPRGEVKKAYAFIEQGDIIAFTSSLPGLDIAHTAIAVKSKMGVGILHASFDKKKVTIEADLFDYMKDKPKIDGIRIIRVVR